MSALSIQPTFPIFTDTDGSPLENGYIWIGTANLNPQTSPITVYWDAALTITATQPIRTQGGYPSRNGSPARLYVNSDYSILVQNKNGSMVYSAPAATEAYGGGIINASVVVYDPAGSGAVATTVQAKLRETVSVTDFGAVGDGVADDTVAVQAAMDSQQPLDWGGLTYRITSAVSRTATKDVFWQGRGATILYAGAHTETAVRLQGGGIDLTLNDIALDGGKLCNKVLEILNDSDNYSNLTCNNVYITRAKRSSAFFGGAGMSVRGSYYTFAFNGGGVNDCELPTGQGTPGTIGIAGIVGDWYSTTRYIQAMYVNGAQIKKIYSSDLSYNFDQDGVTYFAPGLPSSKVKSLFSCINSEFLNCYGRSIKTQCRDTVVQASSFTRTEGLASFGGNGEVDAQTGCGNFRDLTFSYSNGYGPGFCMSVSGGLGFDKPGLVVDGCNAYTFGASKIDAFTQCFPRDYIWSRHSITNSKIFGEITSFFNFLCNGDKNYAEVSNNYVGAILDGSTSEKALIYVTASGAISPYLANIVANGNVYAGSGTAAIVRDQISGSSATASLSAWGNFGFADTISTSPSAALKTNQIARIGKMGGRDLSNAYIDVLSKNVPAGGTTTYDVPNVTGCLLFIQAVWNETGYALICSTGSANTTISKGTAFEIGNTTDPGSGTFRVWSSGTRQISIRNTDSNDREVAVFVMTP